MKETGLEVLGSRDLTGIDAVLLDGAGFPRAGADLCRHLREDPRLARVPFVVAVPRATGVRLHACIEAGADEVLMMPCSPEELRVRLGNMVHLHRNRSALAEKNSVLSEALSDLCESEAMLVQAEKLSVLGEMSAGIVHEITDPLNYSRTALFVLHSLAKDLESGRRDEFTEVIRDIEEGIDRVGHIVRDLRAFAGQGPVETVEVSLSAVVRTARRLLGDRLGVIDFREEVPDHLKVRGNENQLCQVFLNLLKNGVEAAESAGRRGEQVVLSVRGREAGPWVELSIRDNGCGILPADRKRIFEPFFSRKGKGKGMGLGLSICARILAGHRAGVAVVSEPGAYTEFTIRFPRDEAEPAGERAGA